MPPHRPRPAPTALVAAVATALAAAVLPLLGTAGDPAGAALAPKLPACPLSALAKSPGTVDIDFWESEQQANATELAALTAAFNASQARVKVTLVTLGSYTAIWQKYQAGLSNGQLPALVQLTQTDLQGAIDTRSILPAQSCIAAAHYPTADYVPRALSYWKVDGVQEALPFAVSGPVVYYNEQLFTKAGLDPADPPATLPAFMADAAKLKAAGSPAALVLDSWHMETWLATADALFVNHTNGRRGRATKAVFDSPTGLRIWTDLDKLVRSGDAATNPSSGPDAYDNLLGMGTDKYSMTIDSSADLGTITSLLKTHPGVTLGVGPFPVLSARIRGGVEPGGSALYISAKAPAAAQAAAWEFETYLDDTANDAAWAAATGYIPIRRSAVSTATIKTLWATHPGFKVAYEQLVDGPTTAATAASVIGPYPTVRTAMLTNEESMYQDGVSPSRALATAQKAVDQLLATYDQRIGTG
jgi:sn-glycerol 3-phosphate transport system substrate-binding protein